MVVVYSAIYLLLSSSQDKDDRRGGGGMRLNLGYYWSPFDMFWRASPQRMPRL